MTATIFHLTGHTRSDDAVPTWDRRDHPIRVEIYRTGAHDEDPLWMMYFKDLPLAAREAQSYEERGYVARLNFLGE
jgi:hypothetical protein